MSYKLLKTGAMANVQLREYVCDSVNDIENLPNSDPFGSTVFVISTGETYMKNSAGEYTKIEVGTGGGSSVHNRPLEVNAVRTVDVETGKQVITTNKTASEFFDAASEGRNVMFAGEFPVDESGETVIAFSIVVPIEIFKFGGEDASYFIKARLDHESNDELLYCGPLDAGDTVVLIQQ